MIGVAPSLSIIRAKRSIIVLKPDQQASEAEILAHACERIASYKLRNRLILRCTAAHPRQDSQSNSVDGGWVMSRQMRGAARQERLLAPGLPEVWRGRTRELAGTCPRPGRFSGPRRPGPANSARAAHAFRKGSHHEWRLAAQLGCFPIPLARSVKGHEDAFPRPSLSARCRFSQGTFAGTRGNGRDAPIAGIHNSGSAIGEPPRGIHKRARES